MAIDSLLRPAVLFTLAILTHPASAFDAAPAWLGKPDCRIAPFAQAPSSEVSWKGNCLDGHASGEGVLSWRGERGDYSIEATLVRGEPSGEAFMKTPGYAYTGTLKNGLPHGKGYFEYAPLVGQYEGEVVAGKPHGKGILLEQNKSRYTGEWVGGRRHGWGEATFATGGSYTGHWKDNKFDGQGTIVYAGSGHKYEGLFEDGRVAGQPKLGTSSDRYALKVPAARTRLPRTAVVTHFPLDSGWNELTDEHKNKMRSLYMALEPGDEPPFPAKGERVFLDKIRRAHSALGLNTGMMSVHVLVGKEGQPLSVTSYGSPSPALVETVSRIMMLEQYKPALCRGEPCEMVYPIVFNFSVAN